MTNNRKNMMLEEINHNLEVLNDCSCSSDHPEDVEHTQERIVTLRELRTLVWNTPVTHED